MMLTANDLCRQLARHWEDRTAWTGGAGGLVFCEESQSAAGCAIFARPLPEVRRRAALAASLTTVSGEPSDNGMSPVVTLRLDVTARGPTEEQCLELLHDLRSLLRADERPSIVNPYGGSAINLPGVIGLPPLAEISGGGDVWRVIDAEIAAEPDVELPHAGTEEGQSEAVMTLGFKLVRKTLAAPVVAFRLHHDGSGGVTSAKLSFRGGVLLLQTQTTGDYAMTPLAIADANKDTVGELRAAVAALGNGWVVSDINAAHDARPSTALLRVLEASSLGTGQKATFAVIG